MTAGIRAGKERYETGNSKIGEGFPDDGGELSGGNKLLYTDLDPETNAERFISVGNQCGEGWLLTGEMVDLIDSGVKNILCLQPFACLPNHVAGKGMLKALRQYDEKANIVAIDYDPGASTVNQLNRIKLMMSTAFKNLEDEKA